MKHLIRRAGENISAAEVEGILITSPLVKQAAVVSAHDPIREEEVAAFIVIDGGAAASEEAAAEIFRFCAERVASYKLPAWVKFVDELPITSTNKIQKHQLLGGNNDPLSHPGMIDLRKAKASAIKRSNQ